MGGPHKTSAVGAVAVCGALCVPARVATWLQRVLQRVLQGVVQRVVEC